jgi:hypothetical protein
MTALPSRTPATQTRAHRAALVALILAQVVVFMIPINVLGRAIGWPASLRLPPAEALPLIAANAAAVQIGYWGYLVTAAAMVPLVLALRRFAVARGVDGLLVDAMAAFGVAAAVLKTLGIVRWLAAMPALASAHAGSADPAMRAAIEVSYLALNGYAGSVGELLGVQLISGLWLLALGVVLIRTGLRLSGGLALAVGLGFGLTALRTLAPPFALLQAVMPPLGLAWFLLLAVAVCRRG